MSAAIALRSVLTDEGVERRLERIHGRLDQSVLAAVGWDAKTQIVRFPPDHPQFGYPECPVVDCGRETTGRGNFCTGCRLRFAREDMDRDTFIASGKPSARHFESEVLCLVCKTPGYMRPAASNGLCISCEGAARRHGQTVEAYVAGDDRWPPAEPRPSFGTCRVACCTRLTNGPRGFCTAHLGRWRREGEPDRDDFARTAGPAYGERGGNLILTGLRALVIAEVLAGLQAYVEAHRKSQPNHLRGLIENARSLDVASLSELDTPAVGKHVRRFARHVETWITLDEATPEQQLPLDTWDLRAFGMSGRVHFLGSPARGASAGSAPIRQTWLRDASKRWAYSNLAKTRTPQTTTDVVSTVGEWSSRLALRADGGNDPSALGRTDVDGFLAGLSIAESNGAMSALRRHGHAAALRRFLRDIRDLGLTADDGPAARLPATVALGRSDIPPRPKNDDDDAPGDAIPLGVIRQLCSPDALAQLAAKRPGQDAVHRFLIGLNTGRRPDEVCSLRLDCLTWDTTRTDDGVETRLPVLVHDMPKVGIFGYRLEIDSYTAELITKQQARVVARFPHTPRAELALFPRAHRNPHGTKPIDSSMFGRQLREWAVALPEVWEGEAAGDGGWTPVAGPDGQPIPWDRSRLFAYALRHTYAQRHADNGTAPEVLQRLMGHERLDTTLGYFKVTRQRRRDAVERLTPLQVNAIGSRVRALSAVGESDVSRHEVGQVAVPFGVCVEPTNVSAQGTSCPYRHVCTGCKHFRTDPSYLPELRAYLDQLLADRERLVSAQGDVADWARVAAMPSHEEIEAVRRLIRSCEDTMGDLPDDLRDDVEAAIATARTSRAAMTTVFPVHLRGVIRNDRPTIFPLAGADSGA